MILSHAGKTPKIDPSAVVTPTATICGDVTIGPNCRIMHGGVSPSESSVSSLKTRSFAAIQTTPLKSEIIA